MRDLISSMVSFLNSEGTQKTNRTRIKPVIEDSLRLSNHMTKRYIQDVPVKWNGLENTLIEFNSGEFLRILINLLTISTQGLSNVQTPFLEIEIKEVDSELQIQVKENGQGFTRVGLPKTSLGMSSMPTHINDESELSIYISEQLAKRNNSSIRAYKIENLTVFSLNIPKKSD